MGTAAQPWEVVNPIPQPVIVRKLADQTVNNSAVLVDDAELLFTVPASSFWLVDFLLLSAAANALADWQYALSLPAGATARWGSLQGSAQVPAWGGLITTSSPLALATEATQPVAFGSGAINPGGTQLRALVTIGATSGTVRLRWAQNTADPSNSQILAGSVLLAQRLG